MKFYLSSYRIGNQANKLKAMVPVGEKLGLIPNALDYVEIQIRDERCKENVKELEELGLGVEVLDLKNYFGKREELEKKVSTLGGLWVRGGNTFVLRQAMKLSGFDEIIKKIDRENFLYAGYSAGVCVLAPSLYALQQVDDPTVTPYNDLKEVIYEGLGLLSYTILPHYQSKNPESLDIDKEVEFCKRNTIPYKTLRDGEVIVIE